MSDHAGEVGRLNSTNVAGGGVRRFLIMGSQRSGTTLLEMILDVHPEIAMVPESADVFHAEGPLTLLLDVARVRAHIPDKPCCVGFKIPRDTHRFDELISELPNVKIIWISRPVEQVVASMLRLTVIGSDSWAESHAPREIKKYLQHFPEDRHAAAVFKKALSLPQSRSREITLATLCWSVKERTKRNLQSAPGSSAHYVDYGNLVAKTEQTLRAICRFLDLPWNEVLLEHHLHRKGERIGGSVAHFPVRRHSTSKWKFVLSPSDMRQIRRTLRSLDPEREH